MVLFSAPNRAALLLAGLADAAAAWWKATTQEIKEPSAQIVNQWILLEHGPLFIVSPIPGYSLSPDLANAATVSVSLLEGNMKEGSQIWGKMVLKRQDFEMLQSQFFLYSC